MRELESATGTLPPVLLFRLFLSRTVFARHDQCIGAPMCSLFSVFFSISFFIYLSVSFWSLLCFLLCFRLCVEVRHGFIDMELITDPRTIRQKLPAVGPTQTGALPKGRLS